LQADNSFLFYQTQTGTGTFEIQVATTQVLRDPSAWYHIVVVYDSAQGTAANRVKIYINGVQVTAFATATYPTASLASRINAARVHDIGRYGSGVNYFDGYLTEINFIDGQALAPTSFGEFNTTTGVWQPKAYSGTYGTNGFDLNFQDNSGATATTIGKDSSGNGNNWTPNGISVTAGTTYDSMTDVPTLTSVTQGNFCTLNPLNSPNHVLSNGNLTTVSPLSLAGSAKGTMQVPDTGKWYWEFYPSTNGGQSYSGIEGTSTSVFYYGFNGNKYVNGVATAYGATYTGGDVIGVAIDSVAATITFYKNNVSQGAISFTIAGANIVASLQDANTGVQVTFNINFGQQPFTYTPPTGHLALNAYNLPDSAVTNGANQFAATLYTGTGSSLTVANTVNGFNFQPDFVWVKGRSGATDHALYDSVRGTTKQLESNTTTAETTEATGLTAFDSTGFTVGSLAQMNTNAATYVGWQWKASNAAAVSNTSGSITSSVSVNTTAGFSIVTRTGTGANGTIGHGLGIAPKMIINKSRSNGAYNWSVYHASLTNANFVVYLDATNAQQSEPTAWNATAPTSSVFSVGTSAQTNLNTATYVSYCFAEIVGFSKFGSYIGNGAADGPFVYTGFRPRYVCVKRIDTTGGWTILDSSRNPYNVAGQYLFAETSAAEGSTPLEDFLSNGFKLRASSTSTNANTGTYIYLAFAENPFKNALAR
jgi:hypothetical protein